MKDTTQPRFVVDKTGYFGTNVISKNSKERTKKRKNRIILLVKKQKGRTEMLLVKRQGKKKIKTFITKLNILIMTTLLKISVPKQWRMISFNLRDN